MSDEHTPDVALVLGTWPNLSRLGHARVHLADLILPKRVRLALVHAVAEQARRERSGEEATA